MFYSLVVKTPHLVKFKMLQVYSCIRLCRDMNWQIDLLWLRGMSHLGGLQHDLVISVHQSTKLGIDSWNTFFQNFIFYLRWRDGAKEFLSLGRETIVTLCSCQVIQVFLLIFELSSVADPSRYYDTVSKPFRMHMLIYSEKFSIIWKCHLDLKYFYSSWWSCIETWLDPYHR